MAKKKKKKKKINKKILSETKILVSNTNVVLRNSTEIITLTLSTQKEKINFQAQKTELSQKRKKVNPYRTPRYQRTTISRCRM